MLSAMTTIKAHEPLFERSSLLSLTAVERKAFSLLYTDSFKDSSMSSGKYLLLMRYL